MPSQFKANKDNRTGEQVLEDIHQDSKMPATVWILAETIYHELRNEGVLVYKIGVLPLFDKLDNKYKQKFFNLATKILGEQSDEIQRPPS